MPSLRRRLYAWLLIYFYASRAGHFERATSTLDEATTRFMRWRLSRLYILGFVTVDAFSFSRGLPARALRVFVCFKSSTAVILIADVIDATARHRPRHRWLPDITRCRHSIFSR